MRTSPISSDEVRTRCLTLFRSFLFTGMASGRTRWSLGPRFGPRNLFCSSRRPCRGLGPALWPCRLLLLAHFLRPLLFYRRPVLPNGGPCRLSFRPRLDPRLGRRCAFLFDGRSVLLNRIRCRNLLARDRERVRRLRRRKPWYRWLSSRRPHAIRRRNLAGRPRGQALARPSLPHAGAVIAMAVRGTRFLCSDRAARRTGRVPVTAAEKAASHGR
jgi:hypothetical protein